MRMACMCVFVSEQDARAVEALLLGVRANGLASRAKGLKEALLAQVRRACD